MPSRLAVPPRHALSYADDGGPEAMNVPYPSWIARYPVARTGTARYLDPNNGSDANDGSSLALADRTWSAAFTAASAGDTINVVAVGADAVLNVGEFTLSKNLTIQAYPGNTHRVVFDGRTDLSNATWTKDGANARWYATLASSVTWANGEVAPSTSGTDWANLRTSGGLNSAAFPAVNECVYANPVTVNGQIVTGVGTAAAVNGSSTTHFYDQAASRLYLGADPAGKTVKAPIYRLCFKFSSSAVVVGFYGLVFRCYAPAYGDTTNGQAIIRMAGDASVMDNCIVGFSASDNLKISADGCAIRNSHFVYGLTGISLDSGADTNSFTNCYFYRNNTIWKYNIAWHGGGIKMAVVASNVGTFCTAEENRAPGFWRDFSTNNNTWRRCLALNNADFGFIDEKTNAADNTTNANRTVSCVASGNSSGFYSLGAVNSVVVNNTFVNNRLNYYQTEDSRASNQHSAGLIVENNVFSATTGHTAVAGNVPTRHFYADNFSESYNMASAFASLRNNFWHTDPAVSMSNKFGIDINGGSGVQNYASRALFLAGSGAGITGADANGAESTASGDPFLAHPAGGDWTLKPTSAARAGGNTITALVQSHIGGSVGLTTTPPAGATVYPGARPRAFALYHTWTGADNATSNPAANTGQASTAHAGSWGVSSNKGYSSTDADGDFITLPSGVRDGRTGALIEGTLNSASAYRIPRLWFRGIDASNGLAVELKNGACNLLKRDAGTFSQLATAAQTTANGTQYAVEVAHDGAAVQVYVDKVLVVSHTLVGANLKYRAGKRVGAYLSKAGAPGTNARIDDLWVVRS